MSLREKLENNLAMWSLSMLVAGFVAGVGVYKSILEIAQLEVISKSKLEELQKTSSQTQVPSIQKQDSAPQRVSSPKQEIGENKDNVYQLLDVEFSTQFPPFPKNLDIIRPGMRLSEAKAATPNGSLRNGFFHADISSGPFRQVAYYPLDRGEDPDIDFIAFFFRDEEAQRVVMSATLRQFGGIAHKVETLGSEITWANLNGYKLAVSDKGYIISKPD